MQTPPFARIITFGPLELLGRVDAIGEDAKMRYAPLSTDRLNGRGATAAFALLKILLCQPQRHAPRDLLMELLWPEQAHRRAGARLDDAASVLRTLLRPTSGENPLEYRHSNRDSGNSYHLAPYPLIWVDADAFEWYVPQACRLQRFGENALPLWEGAYHLASRGAFLADELYSEWARERRALLAGHYRQCVHEMARLYREGGARADAERVLREHLVREPVDEDALRPFMELLGEQERYQEALDAYQCAQETLAQEGRAPDERTWDIAEYLRTKKITRTRTSIALSITSLEPGKTISRNHPSPSIPLSAQPLLQAGQALSDMDMLRVLFALEERPDMSHLSRRQLLELGIAAFITRLAKLDGKHISAVEREELGHALGESVAAGWKLFHRAGNAEVLAMGQVQLSLIHEAHAFVNSYSLPYLYRGTYDLIGIALHFQERNEEALQAYHNGYIAALATGDSWHIAANLISQADSYHALGQYTTAIQTLEEASRIIEKAHDEASMRLKAHLLSCWADNAMMIQDDRTTQEKLDEAQEYIDPAVPNEEFDRAAWLLIAGKYSLNTRNYTAAKTYLEEALTEIPEQWLLRRAMTAMGLAMAYARLRERDCSLAIAKDLALQIKTLDAQMTNQWFSDYLQQDLLKIFPTDKQVQNFVADTRQQLLQQPNFMRLNK
ncbi:MAG: AfsR/SARP family transcriptional regulator [Ktedonobacteraceae bacterium]